MIFKMKKLALTVILFSLIVLAGCNFKAGGNKKSPIDEQRVLASIYDCFECDSLLLHMELHLDSFNLKSFGDVIDMNMDTYTNYFSDQFDELYNDTLTLNYENLDSQSVLLHEYRLTLDMKDEFVQSKTQAIIENRTRNIAFIMKNRFNDNRNIQDLLSDTVFFKFYNSF